MAYISFQPKDYFNTLLYTGDGNTPRSLTGVGFRPDWIWTKERSSTSSHNSTDVVRGANVSINQNDTGAQATETQSIISFDTDGYTVGSGGGVNQSSQTYVGWNWLAGGSQGSSNTDGSINTTYTSANTTSGFSISKFVGTGANATVGHGLGVVPSMYMVKKLDSSGSWGVYHKSLGATKSMFLDLNDTGGTHIDYWNNTEPTSSVFSVGTSSTMNYNGQNMIAYCFAEKKGFSKFGSYTGNGNADGVYQHLGFSASWIMIKRTDSSASWVIFDNKRLGYNVANYQLYANSASAEGNNVLLDITSQGFKCRANHLDVNGSGASYIFMAFAEHPLVSSNGIPAVAG